MLEATRLLDECGDPDSYLLHLVDISAVKAEVEAHLKLLAVYLLHGEATLLPWGRVGGKDNLDPFSPAVEAIALVSEQFGYLSFN